MEVNSGFVGEALDMEAAQSTAGNPVKADDSAAEVCLKEEVILTLILVSDLPTTLSAAVSLKCVI